MAKISKRTIWEKRTVYVIRFKDDNCQTRELTFNSKHLAIVWLNRAILDYGRMDARLITRRAS